MTRLDATTGRTVHVRSTAGARTITFGAAIFLAAAWLLGGSCGVASAHEGPPFPLFMDKPCGALRVSLWADPDIGDAQFFVVLETAEGKVPSEPPQVALWTQPTSGRLDRQIYPAERQPLRNRMQFEAKPYFDQRDMWNIGVSLTEPGGQRRELTTEVESTPPGLGPWDLAIYLFPFVLMAGLWSVAMFRRRRGLRREPAALPGSSSATPSARTERPSDKPSAADGAR